MPTLPVVSLALIASLQIPFDRVIADLSSPDAGVRLRAVQLLKEGAYPESAAPLARVITDTRDEVQLEAIVAELNIFLAERVVPRKRVGLVVEVRSPMAAESLFSAGPFVIGARHVPVEVLAALGTATHDENPHVALEALYAFGVLAVEPGGSARREMIRDNGPLVAALVGSSDAATRAGAVRVLGRVLAARAGDQPIESTVGDAVITALNDRERAVKLAAMDALGTMRYERALQALVELYRYYGKGELADAALDAMARIAHPSSTPLFVAGLTAKTPVIRLIAVEGLARLRDTSALAAIQSMSAADRGDAVQLAIAFAGATMANAPFDSIAEALTRPRLHDQAKQYLAELAPGRAVMFARFLQDPDARVRADVADALGTGGDATAIPALEPLLKDSDVKVVRAAERALARLRQMRPVS